MTPTPPTPQVFVFLNLAISNQISIESRKSYPDLVKDESMNFISCFIFVISYRLCTAQFYNSHYTSGNKILRSVSPRECDPVVEVESVRIRKSTIAAALAGKSFIRFSTHNILIVCVFSTLNFGSNKY